MVPTGIKGEPYSEQYEYKCYKCGNKEWIHMLLEVEKVNELNILIDRNLPRGVKAELSQSGDKWIWYLQNCDDTTILLAYSIDELIYKIKEHIYMSVT